MRIVIDARMLYWTGVGRYTKALLDNLEKIDSTTEYIVLVRQDDLDKWEPAAANFRKVAVAINPYTPAEQWKLPGVIRKLKPDLVHFTAPNSPMFYSGPKVVTVHDLTLLDFDTSRGRGLKKFIRTLKRWPFRLVFWRAVTSARGIITDTNFVKNQIIERYGIAEHKVQAIWLGTDPNIAQPEPIDRIETGDEFILYVNNFYPYKNAGLILEALSILKSKRPQLKLVAAGKRDFFQDVLKQRADSLGVAASVVFPGFVTDGELVSLYRQAALYVTPSLSEGFGLQGLEAMAQGTPVLSSNATCLPEVYSEAAEYFDPHDANDLAQRIDALLDDPKRREQLAAAGRERLTQFSWRKMAEDTLAAYRRALGE